MKKQQDPIIEKARIIAEAMKQNGDHQSAKVIQDLARDHEIANENHARDLELIKNLRGCRDQAREELDLIRLKSGKSIETARPEPSRLEIAAMLMQGFIAGAGWPKDASAFSLKYADDLIAAAKEEK
jgi:hypothetical protein